MEDIESLKLRINEIEIASTTIYREIPDIGSMQPEQARRARLDFEARIHEIEQRIIKAEEEIAEYEALQRDFNSKGWWYQRWNSQLMNVPVRTWRRTLDKEKDFLRQSRARLTSE
ncbi:MAG: hypothetical protein AAB734_01615 [Patescibacteria group bacterium]